MSVASSAPFAITDVERLPGSAAAGATGAFDLAYTVKPRIGAPDQPEVHARVTCRVGELALVIEPPPEELRRSVGETRYTAYVRPDPFAIEPSECEVAFMFRGDVIGTACLRGQLAFDGSCSDERAARAVSGMSLVESELAVRDGTLVGNAVVTVDAERTGHAARARCEDGARVVESREAAPLPALDGMAAGTSKHVQLTVDLAERLAVARGRCELDITAGGGLVAQFCVVGRRAIAGPCAPMLGSRGARSP